MSWRGVRPWLVAGGLVLAIVMLKDASALLGSVQRVNEPAYDGRALTGMRLQFWDTAELADALRVWRESEVPAVRRVVAAFLLVDLLVFVPALTALARTALVKVGAERAFANGVAVALVVTDGLETALSLVVVWRAWDAPPSFWLAAIQLLSLLKWATVLTGVVAVVALWREPGDASVAGLAQEVGRARSGGTQHPALALAPQFVLVGAFVAVIALPGSGPLAQLPDVIRNHLTDGSWLLWLMTTTALLLFAAAVVVAGMASTTLEGRVARTAVVSTRTVLIAAVLVSAAIFLLGRAFDREWRLMAWSALFVTGALAFAAWLGRLAGAHVADPVFEDRRVPQAERVAWVAILAGVVVLGGSVGLVRAAFAPALLGLESGALPWSLVTALGALSATVGAALARAGVNEVVRRARSMRRAAAIAVVVAVVALAGWLALSPRIASRWGSNGVVALGLAWWSLVIGLLTWVSRTKPRWDATRRLGLGVRTPWLTLIALTWVLASVLNAQGGYHDVRLLDEPVAYTPRYAGLDAAFEDWVAAGATACPKPTDTPVPMVFVAAPGGGIRGAYWTAATLERLFDSDCARTRLFAVSGVSGGSVGTAVWANATGAGASATAAVNDIAQDDALPRALAGLLLRDAPQPLVGLTTAWRDRAALLEDGWMESTGVFGTPDDPAAWSDAGEGLSFVPVLALNGSSVTDACRVVVSNVVGLVAETGPDCQEPPNDAASAEGPVSGAIDPFAGLHGRGADPACGAASPDLRAVSAALTSARFPVVTPSGALLQCIGGEQRATFVVDGGYYENSGLLTLLQVWQGVEARVRAHNASLEVGDGGTEDALRARPIQPWFVVVDNHYTPEATTAPPAPPLEPLVPLTTSLKKILTQPMLEQAAAWEVASASLGGEAGFLRLAPTVRPTVEAPLGWVLSEISTADLDERLSQQLRRADVGALLEQLAGT